MASNPVARLRSIQTGCPQPIRLFRQFAVPATQARRIEHRAHLALIAHRLTGEWFAISLDRAIATVELAMVEPAGDEATDFREDVAIVTSATCRAARGLLDWTGDDLAREAKVALNTVRKFEAGKTAPMPNNLSAIQVAFERAGIEFIPENGGGAGLRMRKAST